MSHGQPLKTRLRCKCWAQTVCDYGGVPGCLPSFVFSTAETFFLFFLVTLFTLVISYCVSLSHSTDLKDEVFGQAVVVHAFNPSTWEADAGRFLSSRPAWFTEWVPGQSGLHEKPRLEKKKQKNKTKTKKPNNNIYTRGGGSWERERENRESAEMIVFYLARVIVKLVSFMPNTDYRHLKGLSLDWDNASIRSGCKAFLKLVTDVARPSP